MEKGDFEGARSLFVEAAGIEPYCVEAWYNRGLASMRMADAQVCGNRGGAGLHPYWQSCVPS